MITAALALVARHSASGVLIDTNLLLLYLVGLADLEYVPEWKRTRRYAKEDHQLLAALVQRIERVVVTPHVATEVSNLATALPEHRRESFFGVYNAVLSTASERPLPLRFVLGTENLTKYGVTDATILRLRRHRPLVLTDDLDLALRLDRDSLPVINFNHLRGVRLGLPS